MYKMNFDILINNSNKLQIIESVVITKSVEQLMDVAEVKFPAKNYNKYADKVKVGDSILVKLGYDDNLPEEFFGYIQKIENDEGIITLKCEDPITLFRCDIDNKQYTNITVNELLKQSLNAVKKEKNKNFGLECSFDFKYDSFVVENATAFDVLNKIIEETHANIFMKDNKLYVEPQYYKTYGIVNYDFSKNIDSEAMELKYQNQDDNPVLVRLEYTDQSGKKSIIEKGKKGGDIVTINSSAKDIKSLQTLLDNEFDKISYTGYSGSFQSWLQPFCDAGYKATIIDTDNEEHTGNYYVLAVETSYSSNGGIRTVTLGKKLS